MSDKTILKKQRKKFVLTFDIALGSMSYASKRKQKYESDREVMDGGRERDT